MSEHHVELMSNGPILVKGPLTLVDAAGQEEKLDKPWVALCRCGQSANKPFCDGVHQQKGFEAEAGKIRAG